MLPALATLADLEARLGLDPGTLSGPDRLRAQAALDDASALVRLEARQSWVDEDDALTTVPDAVVRVVLGAAQRNWVNPDGVLSESVGPFVRRMGDSPSGVYLTDAEVVILRRFRTTDGALWTLNTERDEDVSDTIWYRTSVGSEWFPLASADDVVWPA